MDRLWFALLLAGLLVVPACGDDAYKIARPQKFSGMSDASGGVALTTNLFIAASDEDNTLRVYDWTHEGGPIKVVNTTIGPNNTATVPNSGCCAGGGGVYDEGGQITLDKSHVDGNTATVTNSCCNGGGGVFSIGGTIALANSTVNGNKTTVNDTSNSGNGAGGLFNFGSVIVANSHVDGNSTTVNDTAGVLDGGGGMLVYGGLTVSRSSISSNSANLTETNNSVINGGGGVYTLSGTAGQSDAGNLSGGAYGLGGGFWAGVVEAMQRLYLPLVRR